MKKTIILFFILLSPFTYLNAQQKTLAVELSTNTISTCSAIVQAKDGGYLATGLDPEHFGIVQSYLLKLDSTGGIQWLNVITSLPNVNFITTNSYCNSITLTNNGGYVVAGYSDLYGESVPNVFVMKFDSAGNSLWSETIGGLRGDIGYSIIQTADRGFAITGSASSFMLADTDVYVLKLDSSGNVQWTKTIGGMGDNEGYSIIQTKEGGYTITGKTKAYGAGGYDVYLIKLDSDGNLLWTKTIGGRKNDIGNSIIQSRDGGYAITGTTYSFNDTVYGDVYVIKLDSTGNLQWTRTIGGTNTDAGESIFQTREGDFVIGGYTSSYGSGGINFYFIKFDSAGNLKLENTYGGPINMPKNPMIQTKDGGFTFAGFFTSGYLSLLALDSAGNNCQLSGSGGSLSNGGMAGGGGYVTLSDSGRVAPALDTNINTREYDWTNLYLCRNNNNNGGLTVSPTFTNTGISCLDDSDNGIILSVSGGISPYTYIWTPPISDSSIATGLSAGSYTIMVTDSVYDTVTLAIIIRDILPFDVYCNASNTTCSGIANGSVSVYTVSSENSPYTYSWSNGATTDAISGLSAGGYSVTVFDACGDSGIATIEVGLTIDFTDSAIVINNVNCNSESNGAATINISGGTSPFTYQWSDANSQTNAVSTGLSAGIYSVAVSDACGGSVTSSVTITQPFAFSVNVTSVKPPCYGESNGSAFASLTVPLITNFTTDTVVQHFLVPSGVNTITLTVAGAQGGDDSYYFDSPAPAGNGANFIGVCPVIPGHVLSVVVGQQGSGTGGGGASWVYDSNIVLHSPSGTNGLLAVAAGGGGSESWYGGFNHGNYAGGSGGINLVTNATTFGSLYGAPGGTGGNGGDSAGYGAGGAGWLSNGGGAEYRLSEIGGGMDEANHFSATNDGGGFGGGGGGICHSMAGDGACDGGGGGGYNGGAGYGGGGSFFIDTLPKVSDSGTGNGFVRIEYIVTGYDSTFTYSWSNGETTINATGLSAGTYSLTVTNGSGCSATTSVTITQPNILSVSANTTSNDTCNGEDNGSASSSASGGISPYTYLWNDANSQTTVNATGLRAGTYTINVIDSNGCTASASVIINQPPAIIPTITEYSGVKCNGDSDAVLFANASGGSGFYEYQWSNTSSQTNSLATGLSTGTYTITVTDNNGCSGTASAIITQPPPLIITADSINAIGGNCNGSAWAIVNGGTNPYTYLWTGGLTTDTITNQCVNYYCCTITDANGCIDSTCVNIDEFTGTNEVKGESEKVKVYPNPNNGSFTIQLSGISGQSLVEIYNVLGEKVLVATLRSAQPARTGTGGGDNLIELDKQASGMYFYRVIRENGGLIGEGKIIIVR